MHHFTQLHGVVAGQRRAEQDAACRLASSVPHTRKAAQPAEFGLRHHRLFYRHFPTIELNLLNVKRRRTKCLDGLLEEPIAMPKLLGFRGLCQLQHSAKRHRSNPFAP
ncbi:hypothetical protein CO2235_U770185 [Cupriavidus oxalaticus]|uniref:Uncharacterized protein n=1 Tax=Cupriavidus oxalaticus TaxID=96344 RepID=A0A375FTX2_9BURK|nr:hypothetical protein CO2235_U770185 [Cupriavidus oxalaticus]